MTTASDLSRPALATFAGIREQLLDELREQSAQLAEQESDLLLVQSDASGTESREIVETTIGRLRTVVGAIERALDRIDRGTYGVCDRCGAPIPLERLEAIPEASACVDCAGRHRGVVG